MKKIASSFMRGHEITWYEELGWVYEDTKVSVDQPRKCKKCENEPTEEGHDYCIANMPGVNNACCGHGVIHEAYAVLDDGTVLRGARAIEFFNEKNKEATHENG